MSNLPPLPPFKVGASAADGMRVEGIALHEVQSAMNEWWREKHAQPAHIDHVYQASNGLWLMIDYTLGPEILLLCTVYRNYENIHVTNGKSIDSKETY